MIISIRRVCRYAAVDYCCLNFELPKQCRDHAAGVSCEIEVEKGGNGKHAAIIAVLSHVEWIRGDSGE